MRRAPSAHDPLAGYKVSGWTRRGWVGRSRRRPSRAAKRTHALPPPQCAGRPAKVLEIKVLPAGKEDASRAKELLEAVARQVQPIMRRRQASGADGGTERAAGAPGAAAGSAVATAGASARLCVAPC
jgi:hypothetical protein